MKVQIEIQGNKFEVTVRLVSVLSAGYGHWSINGEYYLDSNNRRQLCYKTTDSELIDAYNTCQDRDELAKFDYKFEDELSDRFYDEIIEFVEESL